MVRDHIRERIRHGIDGERATADLIVPGHAASAREPRLECVGSRLAQIAIGRVEANGRSNLGIRLASTLDSLIDRAYALEVRGVRWRDARRGSSRLRLGNRIDSR